MKNLWLPAALGLLLLSFCRPDLPTEKADSDFILRFTKLVNELREEGCQCGDEVMPPVPPLAWNKQLAQAAKTHASDMASHQQFGHVGSDGNDTVHRISQTGYPWKGLGENLGHGFKDLEAALESWKQSPEHCRILLNPEFREMGAAQVDGYWVHTLGHAFDPVPDAIGK